MKILKVIIKKEWYDLIKSGEKTIEYRDYSDFWISRLENKNGSFRHYDLIEFKNGYKANSRKMVTEFKGISFDDIEYQYLIEVGKIISAE